MTPDARADGRHDRREERIMIDAHGVARTFGPVAGVVLAILLMILGVLVIAQPSVLRWLAGIGLVLTGVALIASLVASRRTAV